MKIFSSILFTLLVASCGGSSSDPATASRDDLNGPKGLRSIAVQSGDEASVTLLWNAFNAEDELRGYDIFGIEMGDMTLADLASKVKYPSTFSESQILNASFPRCEDNSGFFESFGFPKSESDCEGATESETDTSTDSSLASYNLAADEDSPLKSKLDCDGQDSTNVSLPTTGLQLGTLKCVVKNIKNEAGENVAIEAGKTYLFFVAAVAGDEFDELSWISNTVKDTPSTQLFSNTITLATGDSTPTTGRQDSQYVRLVFDQSSGVTVTAAEAKKCNDGISTDVCSLTGSTGNSDAQGIYFGRDNSSDDNRERLFISAPATSTGLGPVADGDLGLQFKRPAISREFSGIEGLDDIGTNGFHPGDSAGASYDFTGTHFPVYGDQIFDFQIRVAGATHYGKVIITNWKIADKEDVTAETTIDRTADVSFNVTVVLQTQAESTDYYSE